MANYSDWLYSEPMNKQQIKAEIKAQAKLKGNHLLKKNLALADLVNTFDLVIDYRGEFNHIVNKDMTKYTRADRDRLDEIEVELSTATEEEKIQLHAERYEIHSKYVDLKTKMIQRQGS